MTFKSHLDCSIYKELFFIPFTYFQRPTNAFDDWQHNNDNNVLSQNKRRYNKRYLFVNTKKKKIVDFGFNVGIDSSYKLNQQQLV